MRDINGLLEKYYKRKISDTHHILEMWVYDEYIGWSAFSVYTSIRWVCFNHIADSQLGERKALV